PSADGARGQPGGRGRLWRARFRGSAQAFHARRRRIPRHRGRRLLQAVRTRTRDMSLKSNGKGAEFVFVPLGGVGEIGMNLYLYGYGRKENREWLVVDMGVTFGSESEPGVDVILPDISFLAEERRNIAGLLLTHAHEDHFGAVVDLWPQLGGVPLYATPFTAEMLKSKLSEMGIADSFPLIHMPVGDRRSIGPFDVELVSMSHSIPEPPAVVIRTPLGAALHTGDWKLDEN